MLAHVNTLDEKKKISEENIMDTDITRSAWLPYPIEALFALINEIEAYPQFLPSCIDAKILSRTEHHILAQMTLSKGGLTKTLTTRNTLSPPHQVKMTLVDGPFKHFEGEWCLLALGNSATKVTLRLSFQLAHAWLSPVIAPLFASMDVKLLQAFCDYAKKTLHPELRPSHHAHSH